MGTGALDPTDVQASTATQAEPKAIRRDVGVDIACRVVDVVVAVIALVLLSPVLLVIAIAIRLESPGPALFKQRRLGRGQAPFTVIKFRTMKQGASHDVHKKFVQSLIAGMEPPATEDGPRFKLKADDRITRVGRILRRTSLDELPQLFNVVHGSMSLVGPRPPISYEVERYPAHWFKRFEVKPGVTGLWQVSGRSELTHEQMIALDIEYVEQRSLRLNLWILIRTIPAVLSLRGAS